MSYKQLQELVRQANIAEYAARGGMPYKVAEIFSKVDNGMGYVAMCRTTGAGWT